METYRSIRSFGSAAVSVQAGNKVSIVVLCRFALAQQQDVYQLILCWVQPCFVFAGEQFENDGRFKLAKSMILDMFRGRLVESINLKVRCSHCLRLTTMCRPVSCSGVCLGAGVGPRHLCCGSRHAASLQDVRHPAEKVRHAGVVYACLWCSAGRLCGRAKMFKTCCAAHRYPRWSWSRWDPHWICR